MDFTIVIPTYNGSERILKPLEALERQVGISYLEWEVLVVDNNSTDTTRDVVEAFRQTTSLALRVIVETEKGPGHARSRGVKESAAPLVGILDDDNIPDSDWIAEAVRFAKAHPNAGILASKIDAELFAPPPKNFDRIKAFFAIADRGNSPHIYDLRKRESPPGAASVFRKEVWLSSVPDKLLLAGPTVTSFTVSEDLEVVRHIQHAGYDVWYVPSMKVTHLISAHRLEPEYIQSFLWAIGLTRFVPRTIGEPKWSLPFIAVGYFLNDLKKVVVHIFKYGLPKKSEPVSSAELKFYIGCLISPFCLTMKGIIGLFKR